MSFDIAVENVVVTARFDHGFDLAALAATLPQAQPVKKFPALAYKLNRPRVTLLVFSSGKIVCTGARSEEEAFNVINDFVEDMKQKGFAFSSPSIAVENVVVSSTLNLTNINIKTAMKNGTVYEPEGFPGIICRINGVKPSFLVFSTGKVVCIGARSLAEASEAIAALEKRLLTPCS